MFLSFNLTAFAQTDTCQTVTPPEDFLESIGVTQYVHSYSSKKFNLFIHIIADQTGHSRISDEEIDDWLNLLNSDFNSGNITFEVVGKEIIKNDYFYYYSYNKFDELISVNPHDNAIDIYFLGDATQDAKTVAKAESIPSTAFVIGAGWKGTSVISHEMGHCLGLYHTHEWRFGKDFDGSGCEEKGDKVCDTPPDPGLEFFREALEENNCQFDENWDISPWICCPQPENIMSYAPPTCMQWFTSGQISRALTIIENSSVLQKAYFYISTPQNLSWHNYSGNPKLTWDLVTNPDADSYNIYRNINNCGEDCGPFIHIASVNGNITSYIDNDITISYKNSQLNAYYYVTAMKQNHESFPSNIIDVPTNSMAKPAEKNKNAGKIKSVGVYPNPFNSSITISFYLISDSIVNIIIYTLLGEEIKRINLGLLDKGMQNFHVDFSNHNYGIYYYVITASDKIIDKGKLVYLK